MLKRIQILEDDGFLPQRQVIVNLKDKHDDHKNRVSEVLE